MIVVYGETTHVAIIGDRLKGTEVLYVRPDGAHGGEVRVIMLDRAPQSVTALAADSCVEPAVPVLDALADIVELARARRNVPSERILSICRSHGVDPGNIMG